MRKEYHKSKDLNTNYVVRLVECAEKFMRIVVDYGGIAEGEFVENAGVTSHFDETGKPRR